MERSILHCDMNNCYASIECLLNPALRGKPMAVGGSSEDRHGIVLAKSEEAKYCGVKTGEPLWRARQKCRDLIVVPPHHEIYIKYGRMAKDLYYEYSEAVEGFGTDEAWVDCTGSASLFGSGEMIAEDIRRRMKREIGLTVSIGVSFNKIFAKLGSDMKKPDAVTVIRRADMRTKIWPRDVSELLGVGRATERKLRTYGIHTIGDLAHAKEAFLERLLGVNGVKLRRYANGLDAERVAERLYERPMQSVGRGSTFRRDLSAPDEIRRGLSVLSEKTAEALRRANLKAGGISLYIRRADLSGIQFQKGLPLPTSSGAVLERASAALFFDRYDGRQAVRALTVRAVDLRPADAPVQLNFFSDFERYRKEERLAAAIGEIGAHYGGGYVKKASQLMDTHLPADMPEGMHPPGRMME
ncbi:MAG: DNA polymerase IV [Eubacteriales bacterium]|nr:DNA polymerase IV [Eubacteriales bacterium]